MAVFLTHPLMMSVMLGDVYDRIPTTMSSFGFFLFDYVLVCYGFGLFFHLVLEAPLTNMVNIMYQQMSSKQVKDVIQTVTETEKSDQTLSNGNDLNENVSEKKND